MKPDSRFFDDVARVAGGAVNIVSGMQQQIRDEIRIRVEEMAAKMDLVPREDFEHVESMVQKLRTEQEALIKRIEALESGKKPAKTATKKTTDKKAKK